MLLDMQGCDYQLFDPAITTKELKDENDDEFLFLRQIQNLRFDY